MNEIKGKIPDYKVSQSGTGRESDGLPFEGDETIHADEISADRIETDRLIPEMAFAHGWQKCPLCQGSGKRFMYSDTGENHFVSDYNDCETCKGKRIISTITGKPPEDE